MALLLKNRAHWIGYRALLIPHRASHPWTDDIAASASYAPCARVERPDTLLSTYVESKYTHMHAHEYMCTHMNILRFFMCVHNIHVCKKWTYIHLYIHREQTHILVNTWDKLTCKHMSIALGLPRWNSSWGTGWRRCIGWVSFRKTATYYRAVCGNDL